MGDQNQNQQGSNAVQKGGPGISVNAPNAAQPDDPVKKVEGNPHKNDPADSDEALQKRQDEQRKQAAGGHAGDVRTDEQKRQDEQCKQTKQVGSAHKDEIRDGEYSAEELRKLQADGKAIGKSPAPPYPRY